MVINAQPNSGSFMSGPTGQPGVGPELARLLAQRNQGGSPSPLNANSTSPTAVTPAAPSQVSAIPARVPSLQPAGGVQVPSQTPQPQPTQVPVGANNPELQIALQALAAYVKSHGKVLEAKNGVQ